MSRTEHWCPRVMFLCFLLAGGLGCRESVPATEQHAGSLRSTEMLLDNEEYSILEMATAHGAFTIEVAVDSDADTLAIAEQLIAPIVTQYVEILVYFYDRADDGELRLSRVQWTNEAGFTEVDYE